MSLVNDLYSFEKERNDTNVQNAIPVIMKQYRCDEKAARKILKHRIRIENANIIKLVEATATRPDLSADSKRYIRLIQYTHSGNVAWSPQCPRYNEGAKWSKMQLMRAEHGVKQYPATLPSQAVINALLAESFRKSLELSREDIHGDAISNASSTLPDAVSLALDMNLPDLDDSVSSTILSC